MHLNFDITSTKCKQRGISLIESLIAMVVMALGILGILGVQMRTLADTQTGVRRAQAIRLIEDLSERVQSNPNALGNLGSYASSWDSTHTKPACASGCTPEDQAKLDIYLWKESIKNNLPTGKARVFISTADSVASNQRQLGVMIGWRENEREGTDAADTAKIKDPFVSKDTATTASADKCPDGLICHLQYIQPNQRCNPFALGSETKDKPLYCPS